MIRVKSLKKRGTAVLLSVVMMLGMLPANTFAEEKTDRYDKISNMSELTDGEYVLVSNAGYAVGAYDGSWLPATAVVPKDNAVENPAKDLIWNITVSGSSIVLQDANGTKIKPPAGANNGIQAGEYYWDVTETGGLFNIKGTGADVTTLAGNASSENKFRAYKNTTIAGSPNGYPKDFTLYRFAEGSILPDTQVKMPKAVPEAGRVIPGTTVELSSSTPGAVVFYNMTGAEVTEWTLYTEPIVITADTTIWAKAEMEDGSLASSEMAVFTYTLPAEPGEEGDYSLYFGQLHSHTGEYSDGSGKLSEALNYIRGITDKDNVDFVGFTDHSNYFDTTAAANPEAALYDVSQMTAASRTKWDTYKSTMRDFNSSQQKVVALAGFEMTWSGGPGHINTFHTPGVVSRNNKTLNNKVNDAGMKAYYELLSRPENADSISQFNHPGTTFGTFSDFAYWNPVIDSRINLIEVGNGEGAIRSGGYFPSYEYYTMALDKGWHVAPTNNQDNHKGKWGNANDARDVILTDSLNETSIYQAVKERRLYASEDKNLEIMYTVNDQVMGSQLGLVPETLNFKVSLNDPDDKINKAELIANSGRVAYKWDVNAQSKELSATLSPEYSYYYLRVTEADGDIAVTAPVWVGEMMMLGVNSIECSTATPVTGEELTLTTTLFNSERSAAAVKSLTYRLDGKELEKVVLASGILPSGGSLKHEFKMIPKTAKQQTVSVEAEIELDGKTLTYKKEISLDIRDVNQLVFVGIDGSHYNEYVAGNYKDSMTNFTKMAADHNVRCVILKTSGDFMAAAKNENGKYKMLVLTAPSRRDGSALRNPYANYSNAEIEAVKGFSEAGGTVVIGNWSDFYENYGTFPKDKPEDQMAAQQNKLLKALGSSLRVSDDGTNDDTLNGGQMQRLYLSTYNFDNFLMKGVVFDAANPNDNKYSQVFSHYGGSSIYAVDGSGSPANVIPKSVSPIVYGHSSTYSTDSDKDGLGGSGIPKYAYKEGDNRLLLLASETLTHANGQQSLVVAGGAAFMSNFEIKMEADNNAELNYSNYNILENLITYINPVNITSIAAVQAQPEEGVMYTIEGTITSNASGYDKDTAFFDCIYLQDNTAGINAFPVAGDFRVGQKVRITGSTSSYQGERQLNVKSITLLGDTVAPVEPKEVTAKGINERTWLGSLVKLSGTVVSYTVENGIVQSILVKDAKGDTARVFIDGYITADRKITNLKEGCKITVVGLSSYDNTFDGLPARIRVRDRADIVCTLAGGGNSGGGNNGGGNNGGGNNGGGTQPTKPSEKIIITKKDMLAAKAAKTGIVVSAEYEGLKYQIIISRDALKAVTDKTKDMNVTLAKKSEGVLSLGKNEKLSVPAEIRLAASQFLSVKNGTKLYTYLRDKSGKLTELPNSPEKVREDGIIVFYAKTGGDFVFSTEKIAGAVRLIDKVSVKSKTNVKAGKKLTIAVKLPAELKKVKTFGTDTLQGQEKVKISYSVNNKKLAKISASGVLTGKKKGTIKVSVKVITQSGEKRTITKKIVIKK